MLRFAMSVAALLGSMSAAQAQLAIQNIQACYGPCGPERPQLQYHHLERVCFRFTVMGASADEDGQVDLHTSGQLVAPDGTSAGSGEKNAEGLMNFGPIYAEDIAFPLPQHLAPGEYTLTVMVHDQRTKQTASFERKLLLEPDELAICSPEFFYDADGQIAAPFGGVVNQKLHLRFIIIGINTTTGRSEVETRFEVFDAKTRRPLCKPVIKVDQTANSLLPQLQMRLSSQIALHWPGKFILRISATDRLANKTATLEVPIHVAAP
jgi:hypothetical protein